MNENILLKQLFIELYDVNHLMLDLIGRFEDEEIGNELLINFYVENLTNDYTAEELTKHRQNVSYSCLGGLSDEEFKEFLNSYRWRKLDEEN